MCYLANYMVLPNCILLCWVHFHNDFTSLNIKGVDIHDKVTNEVSAVNKNINMFKVGK
jgi:hypothetical protein